MMLRSFMIALLFGALGLPILAEGKSKTPPVPEPKALAQPQRQSGYIQVRCRPAHGRMLRLLLQKRNALLRCLASDWTLSRNHQFNEDYAEHPRPSC